MRKKGLIPVSLLLCLLLTGCSGNLLPVSQDITNVELMRTLALDPGEEEPVLVTVSSAVKAGTEGSEPTPPVVLSEEGITVYGACLSIQTQGDSYVSYGAVNQCLVSEEAVEEGMEGLMDFLKRDYEMRMDTKLFLASGDSAGEFLKQMATDKTSAADRLESIARDYELESEGWAVTVRQALIDLADNGCAILPVVELGEEDEEATIETKGMAWISDHQVQERLYKEEARAAAILSEQAKGGAEEVTLSNGAVAGLKITKTTCSWEPQWQEGRVTGITCHVKVKADIAELRGGANPADQKVLSEMETKLSAALKGQIQGILASAQETGEDVFHMRRQILTKCASKSALIEKNWDEWYPDLTLSVNVVSDVERSYEVSRGSEES